MHKENLIVKFADDTKIEGLLNDALVYRDCAKQVPVLRQQQREQLSIHCLLFIQDRVVGAACPGRNSRHPNGHPPAHTWRS